MLDYQSLAALGAVIREGSFERAATSLAITPSAVSQRVRGLEERLGAILVVRSQPCRPTELGRALCAHLDRVRLLEADLAPALSGGAEVQALRIAVNADSLATWFPQAAAAFAQETGVLLDLTLDDEDHTAERLRSGEVLAVVTADPKPVQGCRTVRLGAIRYAACASPAFVERHFAGGVDAASLATAPHLRFDRRDGLQARWARETLGVDLAAPTAWAPSTHGMLDLALAGLGWGMQPVSLAEEHLAAGRLMELVPGARIEVELYWIALRLPVRALDRLTAAVRQAALQALS
ncbi:LysR family transcriptional regulator ArgP [Aureimonas mangrovi]|uniref:LysR family transcriptional regulator ArgP n=1 Tax=Aureimonas mangrovi TaxID=2758041 RepID=UPI00163D6414|nr:LysR family transcriptional regulator ArgP [Aureimonas mangrovi]